MLDFIMGIILAIWLMWCLIRIIMRFDEDIADEENITPIMSYIIDLGMVVIFALWLIFRFRT